MDEQTRKIYFASLAIAKNDAENGTADIYELDDMVRLLEEIDEGATFQDIYTIGSNSIIDRALESEGLMD